MGLSIIDKMGYRIRGKGRGWVFSARHFLDFGTREAVDVALHRMAAKQTIRRLTRGIYDYPRIHRKLGALSPSIDSVAQEIAEKNKSRLKITGAEAANALGLTTQVPAKIVYLTDGFSRKIKIGKQTIEFRHASPAQMATAGTSNGTVIQALAYIGKKNIEATMINKLKELLTEEDRRKLKKDMNSAPDWMRPVILELTRD